jgi:histidyl-tRNA synthetase
MLNLLFEKLEVKNLLTKINSLGCSACRKTYNEALLNFIGNTKNLCEDCERRKNKNPLRILDCKVESCQKQLEGAPLLKDYLCDECKAHFTTLKQCLDLENIKYETDDYLVRGLDYYTKTAFEIQTKELGAQSAVAGGGRYDGLVEILGGPKTPGIGFAIGFDRLVEIVSAKQDPAKDGPLVYFLAFGENAGKKAFKISNALASQGIKAEMDFSDKSMKAAMKKANKSNCRFCAIIGENEVEKGVISLKNMEEGTQEEVWEKDFISIIKKYI